MTLKTVGWLALAFSLALPSGAWARNTINDSIADPVPLNTVALTRTAPRLALAKPVKVAIARPAVPSGSAAGTPQVDWSWQRLSCVPYARLRSGLQIFGDARHWWDKARDLYARLTAPVTTAVMVFSGSKRNTRGHVAVVTEVISPREIRVDHANWQNKGEIDLNMPVLDVSPANDWSAVRVWNVRTNSYGSNVYPISGFITAEQAKSADQ